MTPRTALRPLGSAAAAALLLLLPACGGPSGPIDGARAFAHVQRFCEIGPRPFGSENLARTADYICAEIGKLGLVAERQEEVHEKEQKTIRNLYTRIDGPDPERGPILILGAHYDTKLAAGHSDPAHNFPFVGAIDGGGGPAVLLELARELKARQAALRVNVWLYWIDAEESIDWTWNDERALLGSKAFCRWLAGQKLLPRVKAFVLLDLIGDENLKLDRDGNSTTRLLDVFGDAAAAMGESARMFEFPTPRELEYYKSRNIKWGIKDDHITFTNFGVPSVLLIDFELRIPPHLQQLGEGAQARVDPRFAQWWHTPDDDLDQVSPDSLAFAGNLVIQALPQLEDFVLGRRR